MAYDVNKVLNIAEAEVGYLEKKSNNNLDSKTGNAGYGNFTKYARDLDALKTFYNTRKNGFAWCDIFVDWCFVKAFGVEAAKKLLGQPNKSCGAGCGYSANYFKSMGQFHKSPKVGDQIFFIDGVGDVGHTGLVYKVDNNYVYTIEGNTSSASGVIANGGGVFKKKYSLSYNRIYGYGRPNYDGATHTQTNTVSRNYLMRGDSGEAVKTMQESLIKLGYSCGTWGADGNFGASTETALKNFQKSNGLVVDGKYGTNSKAKVEFLLSKLNTPTSRIDTVKAVQEWANKNYKSNIAVDGVYGRNTKAALVKILQTEINKLYNAKLVVDGIWGTRTRAACPTLVRGLKNNIVGVLQAFLICNGYTNVYLDNCYGSITISAVMSFQKKKMIVVDGKAGKNTFAKLCM